MGIDKERRKDILFVLMICAILIGYMIYYLPNISEMHSFCVDPYVIRYDLGFISRGLIGSLLGIIFPVLSSRKIYVLILCNQMILILVVAVFFNVIRKRVGNNEKSFFYYFTAMLLLGPASVSYLFYWGNFGRYDLFMIVGTLVCCMLLIREKHMWLIPVIAAIMIMIHQGVVFYYLPCLFTLLCAVCIKEQNKRSKIVLGLFCLISGVAFLYFQFFGKIGTYDLDQTMNLLSSRTNLNLDSEMVKLEYFTPIQEFVSQYIIPNLHTNVRKCIYVLILMLPVEYVICKIWRIYLKNSEKKYVVIFPVLIIVALIPEFAIACDYGRHFASMYISLVLQILMLRMIDKEAMGKTFREMQQHMCKYKVLYFIGLVELIFIGKFEAANILDITNKFL